LAQRDAETRPDAAARAAALPNEQGAQACKRQLLAELERERMARTAAGDIRGVPSRNLGLSNNSVP
jgi:hypothetical protein